MPTLTYSASITISADTDEVYALVSDIERIGESSPTCRKIAWEEGEAGAVGSVFTGYNEVQGHTWETRNEVLVADGASFGWTTGPGIATWTYSVVASEEAGTSVLTESWELAESGQEKLRSLLGERGEAAVANAPANTKAGVDATLAAMKKILESA